MEPTRDSQATLLDLLERILDKGLILDADIIVSIAGIPLLGIKLNAAIASMDTMIKYGIWKDWDDAQRLMASVECSRPGPVSATRIVDKTVAFEAGNLGK
jgi:hypothetical protein